MLIAKVPHCHQQEYSNQSPRNHDVFTSLDLFHNNPISRDKASHLLPPRFFFVKQSFFLGIFNRNLRTLDVFNEFRVSIMKKKIVMNERLPRDNTKQVDQPLGGFTHVSLNDVAPRGGVEDGEVDIGVGVGRVEEAKKAN
ncbi:hypothetical protein TorRG33x02_164350 [Trema orientale]|uniref:Uncharacterized protein n=1 Tax=Trema orientale TaxID=63057 RepID=A0A2P5EQA7_TREOI|nr:hypothetical protein TorRG33x02_164350 [Trema orientale]